VVKTEERKLELNLIKNILIELLKLDMEPKVLCQSCGIPLDNEALKARKQTV
jgi:hypothetical protein